MPVARRLLPHAAPRAVPDDIDVFEGEEIAAMACGLCVHPLRAIIVALQCDFVQNAQCCCRSQWFGLRLWLREGRYAWSARQQLVSALFTCLLDACVQLCCSIVPTVITGPWDDGMMRRNAPTLRAAIHTSIAASAFLWKKT